MENETSKKRGEYITKRKKKLESLLIAAKDFKFVKKEKEKIKSNPARIAEFTKDSCMYPSRYLNNDNTCVTCDIYEHCACKIKTLGKKRDK